MNEEKFIYVIYINSTPDKVWKALLDGELTREYWGHENVSDWKPGSNWEHKKFDKDRTVAIVGEVIECNPHRRLVLTWAYPADGANKSKHTRVAIDLEQVGTMVRLTVTHSDFPAGSDMLPRIANGWPRVLSSLKSFLETGRALNTWA
jgi:uncharacterized protein YndB with AHSA1/START domain